MTRGARRLVGAGLGTLTAVTTGAIVLRVQAGIARRAIGKPLGEEAHRPDKTYKKKYGDRVDLLLLGDSIAAGLGADKPKHTLGAQLARRVAREQHRSVRLLTAARVGAETSMLRAQLADLPAGYRADVAVIVVGGNDVTHRVPISSSVGDLREVVRALQQHGTRVVVGTCPDLSALPGVPQPLRTLAGISSRQLAAAQTSVAASLDVRVVPLASTVGPFFLARPEEMFAVDRFHPSSAGYKRAAKALLPTVVASLPATTPGRGGVTLASSPP